MTHRGRLVVGVVTPADRLRQLADAATPGPWRVTGFAAVEMGEKGTDEWEEWWPPAAFESRRANHNARLIALAPEIARLLADAMDALREHEGLLADVFPCICDKTCARCSQSRALLVRLAALTGGST